MPTTNTTAKKKKVFEDICHFLDVPSSRKKPRILSVDSYLDRLRTFTSSNYFAKPIGVSPIVCAAHGWHCIQTDIVECSNCHAKVAIVFDPSFTPTQQETMTKYYYEKLARKGHESDLCLFYDRKTTTTTDNSSTIPFYLASAWDSEMIQLLSDSVNPLKLLTEDQIPYLVKNVKTTTPRYPIFPRIPIKHNNDDLELVRTVLTKMGDASNPKACRLALFGWTKGTCRLCAATMISSKTTPNNNDVLLSCHKYYCPFRCGIVEDGTTTTEPCWKMICQRVLSTTTTTTTDTAEETSFSSAQASLEKIQSILNEFE